ncbi:MAG: hypothetical protein WCC26_11210 [Terracidiphilus sp.]
MKLLFLRALAVAALAVAPCIAQSNSSTAAQTPSAPIPQNSTPPAPQPSNPRSTVIFSRSTGENGNVTNTAPANTAATQPPSTADNAERLALAFTAYDLDVHLQTAAHRIAARALVTVRNDGKTPLTRIPLQLSSSLTFEQVRLSGRNAPFSVATLNADTDHTGQLHEAVIPLASPLAPGNSLELDVAYSGSITPSAQRLVALGTPESVALHADWDEISPAFTGLRGFGDVAWYPTASLPVLLGDGSRVFDEIGRHKLSLAHARFRLRLTVEYPRTEQPTVALINGLSIPLSITDPQTPDPDLPGIATGSFETPALGFLAPSLFVAERTAHTGPDLTAFTTADNDISVQSWITEADAVAPFLHGWLGHHPRAQLTLLDLPDPDDAPFETGALLATSLGTGPADKLDGALVHAFAHAYTLSPETPAPAWLNEGLATFLESLWVEKNHGRDRALEMLETDRSALALLEPASPGQSSGTPLAVATEPVYYRTKAAYVFWMLRDLTSGEALSSALQLFYFPPPAEPGTTKSLTGNTLYDCLRQAGVKRDLSWFFSGWVDADKGLPDLSIEDVFPNAAQAGTWLVAVNVTNTGYVGADVPVTVRTANNFVTERVFVPARGHAVERLVVMGPPTQVQLNDGAVPEISASVHVTDVHLQSPDQPAAAPPPPRGTSSSTTDPASTPQ